MAASGVEQKRSASSFCVRRSPWVSTTSILNSTSPALQAYTEQGAGTTQISSAPSLTGTPTGIAFDSVSHDLYVSTTSGVYAYAETGLADGAVSAFSGLSSPSSVAYDSNTNQILVADKTNSRVYTFAAGGGAAVSSFPTIVSPAAIAYDSYAHVIFVANALSIAAYSESGALQTTSFPSLSAPSAMTVVQ